MDLLSASHSASRVALLHTLTLVKPAVGRATFVPVLSHFCFTGTTVVACDDRITIEVPFPLGFVAAVPADLLVKQLQSLVADEVDFELKGNALVLLCGKSRLQLPTLPPERFVFQRPKDAGGKPISITQDVLNGIRACLMSVSTDPTHPAQLGVTMAGVGENALYSTDNVTMSRHLLAHPLESAASVILPTSFCQQLLSLSTDLGDDVPLLRIYQNVVAVEFPGGAYLEAKRIEVPQALDYAGVFKRMVPAGLEEYEVPQGWDTAFQRAQNVSSPLKPVCSVSTGAGVLVVSCSTPLGDAEDSLDVDGLPGNLAFDIDPGHVLRASKFCGAVSFAKSAMVLRRGTFVHLISHCKV